MANRVPGLRPLGDRPSMGGRNTGRVATPGDIRLPGLRPAASPVDTYARPEAPAEGPSELMQLANALATVSPSLNNFLNAEATRQRTDMENLANRRIGGMSFEEAEAAVKNGSIHEMNNPWFKAAFMKQYGERLGYQRINELTAQYEASPEKADIDFDDFVAQQMAADLEQYGDDKFFTASYSGIMQTFNAKGGAQHAQLQNEEMKEEAVGGVYDTFLGRARSMLGEGKTPDEIAAALRAGYDANKTMLGVDFKAQDAEMIRVAEALAQEGHLDLVTAILKGSRTGTDGTNLGALADNRLYATDSARILTVAENKATELRRKTTSEEQLQWTLASHEGRMDEVAFKAWHDAHPEVFTQDAYESMIVRNQAVKAQVLADQQKRNAEIASEARYEAEVQAVTQANLAAASSGTIPFLEPRTVTDAKGNPKVLTVDDQKADVAAEISRIAAAKMANEGLEGQEAFDLEASLFITNQLSNPKWEATLAGGHSAANGWAVTPDKGEVPPPLKTGLALYEQLHAKGPAFLRKHIKDTATMDFYEAYRIAHQEMGWTEDKALAHAIYVTKDPTRFDNPAWTQKAADIENEVNATRGFLGPAAGNEGELTGEISRIAQQYAFIGHDSKEALKLARERVQQNYTKINNWWVKTSDADLPPDFGQLVETVLKDYAEKYGAAEDGLEFSDLTIRPTGNGNGQWMIITKTGLPVDEPWARALTMKSIIDVNKAVIEAKKQAIIDAANARQEASEGINAQQQEMFERLGSTGSLIQ